MATGRRSFAHFNARKIYPLTVRSDGHGHAFFRKVDAIDLSPSRDGSQLTEGSASAAAHIEDYVLFPYRSIG